ncbi:MAG: hypothetical protein P4M11_02190, partial [Candidatus Pacebacteria bacterium]|nr:hypothetical protein [Candidatus Paceibacterota bacterium]
MPTGDEPRRAYDLKERRLYSDSFVLMRSLSTFVRADMFEKYPSSTLCVDPSLSLPSTSLLPGASNTQFMAVAGLSGKPRRLVGELGARVGAVSVMCFRRLCCGFLPLVEACGLPASSGLSRMLDPALIIFVTLIKLTTAQARLRTEVDFP